MADVWATINDRQRAYLRTCYTIDQDKARRNRAAHTHGSLSSESEWLLYGPTLPASSLLHQIRSMKLEDVETLPTFRSLELLELLRCRYEQVPPRDFLLYVQLTPRGRYVTRTGIGLAIPILPKP